MKVKFNIIYRIILFLFLVTMIYSVTEKIEANTAKFEISLGLNNSGFIEKEDLVVKGTGANTYVELDLMIKSITGKEEPLSSLGLKIEQTNGFIRILRVDSVSEEDDWGDLLQVWNNAGSSTTASSSSIISLNENPEFVGYTIPTSVKKLATIRFLVDINSIDDNMSLNLIFDDAAYDKHRIKYNESDFVLTKLTIGNPQSGPDLSMNPTITYDTNKTAVLTQSGNSYTAKKTSSTNFKYADTENMYLETNIADGSTVTVTVTKNGTTTALEDIGGKKFKLGSLTKDTIFNVEVANGGQTETYTVTIKVDPPSTSPLLKSITTSNGKLSPNFEQKNFNYTLELPFNSNSTIINYEKLADDLIVVVTGNKTTYSNGDKVLIKVSLPHDGTITNTYTITINIANASTTSELDKVAISANGITTNLEPTNLKYTLPSGVSNFNFVVHTVDEKSTVKINAIAGKTMSGSIDRGVTVTYNILITAENGINQTNYTLTVTRAKSSNANISLIKVIDGGVTYPITNVNDYEKYYLVNSFGDFGIEVNTISGENATVKSITRKIDNTDILSAASLKNEHIAAGEEFEILIEAEDGTPKTYTLVIDKKSSENSITKYYVFDINGLASFGEAGYPYEITYNNSNYRYLLTLPYKATNRIEIDIESSEKSMIEISTSSPASLDITKQDDNRVSVVHNYSTTEKQTITFNLRVKAENGNTITYTFEIIRESANDEKKLDTFEIEGSPVLNFKNNTEGGTYETIYIKPQTLTDQKHTFTLNAKAISENSKIRITIDGQDQGLYNDLASISYTITSRGKNYSIVVQVFSEKTPDTAPNIYKVDIVYASDDITINNLSLKDLVYEVKSESDIEIVYEVQASFSVRSTQISFDTPSGANSTITSGAKDVWTLSVGDNTKSFTITSESKRFSKTYTFEVEKANGRTYKDLDSLKLILGEDVVYTFNILPEITTYSYRIDDKHESFSLNATIKSNEGATLTDGQKVYQRTFSKAISSGTEESVTITVYDENNETQNYFIKILRANNDYSFQGVTIDGITYDKSQFIDGTGNYGGKLVLDNVLHSKQYLDFYVNNIDTKASIIYPKSSKVELDKWELKNSGSNNSLTFQVKAQDGSTSLEYEVVVFKEAAKTNNQILQLEISYTDSFGEDKVKTYNNPALGISFDEIVGKGVNNVVITVRILKEHRSKVDDFNLLADDDNNNYYIYQKAFTTDLINVNVRAENGDINTHTIKLHKLNNIDVIKDIEIIDIENKFDFPPATSTTINVREGTNPFIIRIYKEDRYSKLIINNTQKITDNQSYYDYHINPSLLNTGINNIEFKLQSEYNFENSILEFGTGYTFIINKEAKLTKNNLKDLHVNLSDDDNLNLLKNFLPTGSSFETIRLDTTQQSVIVKAYTLANEYSTVQINGKTINSIESGDNLLWQDTVVFDSKETNIKVTVFAEDKTKIKEYVIPINRQSDENTIEQIVVTINGISTTYNNFSEIINLGEVSHSTNEIEFEILRSNRFATVYLNDRVQQSNINNDEYILKVTLSDPNITTVNKMKVHLKSEYGTDGLPVNFEITRKKADTNTKLKELEIINNGENLFNDTNSFSPNINKYQFIISTTKSNQIFVTAKSQSELSKTVLKFGAATLNDIDGENLTLESGLSAANILEITVTSESGATYTYTIYIYYANNNSEIDSLEITDNENKGNLLNVNFDTNNSYTESIDWDFGDNATFNLKLADEYASYKIIRVSDDIELNPNNISLNEGLNRLKVVVTSNYGLVENSNYKVGELSPSTKTYTLNILKGKANKDTNLTDLKIINVSNGSTIAFDRSFDPFDSINKVYNIKLNTKINIIRVEFTKKEHQTVAYDTGDITLNYDSSDNINKVLTITVTAQGVEDNYRIRITKGEDLSKDTSINSLIELKGPNHSYNYDFNVYNENNPLVMESTENYIRILQSALIDPNSTIENDVIENIVPGKTSKLSFVVIAEDGLTKKTYELYVLREGLSADNTLSELEINANGIIYYINEVDGVLGDVDEEINVTVPRTQNIVMISTKINDIKATGLQINAKKINGTSVTNEAVNVVTGKLNIITITVVAENGDIKVYRINVNLRDTDATIGLEFELDNKSKLTPEITKDEINNTIVYNLGKLNYNEKTLNIIANKNGNNFVTIDGYGLKQLPIGSNEFIIKSTSEDQSRTITHKVIVERLDGDNSNKLSNVEVYVPLLDLYLPFEEGIFDPNSNLYTINIDRDLIIKSVQVITSLPVDSKATITGNGLYQLNEINGVLFAQITIVVTSETGENNNYIIQIVKGGSNDGGDSPEPENDDATIKEKFQVKGPNDTYTYDINNNDESNPLVINSNENYIRLINATNDPKATVLNDLFDDLKQGLNIINIDIQAENGDLEHYEIYIYKEELSDDNTLKSLTVRYNGVNYYEKTNNDVEDEVNITLDRTAKEITITAIKNDLKASNPQISSYTLEAGKLNTITVTVVAENGDIKVYRINISLRDTKATIGLEFELENKTKITPEITNDEINNTITYNLGEINYNETILNIIANKGFNEFITVIGDGLKQLTIGENEFIITATSEDQATIITHKVIIERLDGDSNNLLDDLYVENNGERIPFEQGSFDPNLNHYTIRLAVNQNFDRVFINAILTENSKANIVGNGELSLKDKNGMIFEQARIVVTSETGIENIYTIEIIKASSVGADDDNSVKEIYVKGLVTNKQYQYVIGNSEPIIIDKLDEFVEIVVVTNSNKAIISGQLVYKLVSNQIVNAKIVVQSENLELTNEYSIIMKREQLNTEALIEEILINGKELILESNKFDYTYLVDKLDNKITIDITLSNGAKSNHEIPLVFDFNESIKVIKYSITSEDGNNTNIYTIELRKNDYEVKLESIIIDEREAINDFQDLLLNLGTRSYKDNHFTISATAVDNDAKVTISVNDKTLSGIKELTYDANLDVGQNEIKIFAESNFGESSEYIIIIEREEASNNNLLDDLNVTDSDMKEEYQINFIPTTNRYVLQIDDEDNLASIYIEAIKGEINQVIEGDGLQKLSFSNSGLISETIKVKVTAENGEINIYEIVITRNIQPETDISVNRLSLIGNNGVNYLGTELNALEDFISGVYQYNLVIPYEVERLILTVVNNNGAEVSFISGNGTYSLKGLSNLLIEFYLTSKDGTTNNNLNPYTINIVKEEPSEDNTLEELTINGNIINGFNPDKTYYEISVDSDVVKQISINAIANNEFANINGLGNKQIFEFSDNVFTIRVTAQNGDIKDYIINIKSQSNDNIIKNIAVDGFSISPTFSENVYVYTLDVEYSVDVVEILVSAHMRANVTGQGFKRLAEGINNIEIYATSESGIRGKIYSLRINRLPISDDNTLKSISVKDAITGEELNYEPTFNKDILGYVIVLDKTSSTISITIDAEPNNRYATVGGLGFHNLENKLENTEFGNIFNITVRAQNGDTRTYQLKVYKGVEGLDSDARINNLTLIGSDQTLYLGNNSSAITKFNNDTTKYNIKVPYTVNTLTLNVLPVSSQATIYYMTSSIQSFESTNQLVFEFYIQSPIGTISEVYEIVINREEPLSDNTLENIKIDSEFIQEFNPHDNEYEIHIPYNSTNGKINLEPIVKPGNKVSVQGEFGEKELKKGKNIFPIIVTSEDGKQNTYTIIVYHYNNNSKLEELTITGEGENPNIYKVEFDSEKFEYNIVISQVEKAIIIKATAQDQEAGIYGATRRELSAGNGSDKFDVTVVAEDGITTNVYTIRTSYNQDLSNNTKVDVRFSNIAFQMFDGQMTYHLPLKKNLKTTQITVTPQHNNAIVDLSVNGRAVNNNTINLEDNNNLITIRVTAEDGTTDYYSINIEKEPAQDVTFIVLLILTFILWFVTIIVIIIKRNKTKEPVFTDVIY